MFNHNPTCGEEPACVKGLQMNFSTYLNPRMGIPHERDNLIEPAAATARRVGTSQLVGSASLEDHTPACLPTALGQGKSWLLQRRGSTDPPARVKVQLSCCMPNKKA